MCKRKGQIQTFKKKIFAYKLLFCGKFLSKKSIKDGIFTQYINVTILIRIKFERLCDPTIKELH